MADTKISDLTEATSLADTDLLVIAQEDTANKKVSWATVVSEMGAADPIAGIFGAPDTAFEFDTSSFTGLTAMGTPDAENADTTVPGHYYVRDDGTSFVGRYAATPSTPFTAIAKLSDTSILSDFGAVGLMVGVGTPGAFDVIALVNGTRTIAAQGWSNPSLFGGSIAAFDQKFEPPLWFALVVNSTTDIDFLWSMTGLIWKKLVDARNPSLTVGSVGVAHLANGAGVVASAFDYLRIFNSALTFPGVP